MESLGLHRIPPMEPFVAAQLSVMSSRSSSLLSKSNRFQSVLTEKTHGAAALSARVLNVLLLLTELCEDFARTQDPATWEEIPVITDLCVRVQRCAVQTVGKVLGTMVLQEQASLSDREKDNVLNMPTVQEGIFGSALASMQRCARSKKEDEELSPEKIPIFSSAGGVQGFHTSCRLGSILQDIEAHKTARPTCFKTPRLQMPHQHSLHKLHLFSPRKRREGSDRPPVLR